jgi:hypothetical protein
MNIKRGLKRLWFVGSVLWVLLWVLIFPDAYNPFLNIRLKNMYFLFGVPIGFWILLYMGFWVSSGFSSDENKDGTNG